MHHSLNHWLPSCSVSGTPPEFVATEREIEIELYYATLTINNINKHNINMTRGRLPEKANAQRADRPKKILKHINQEIQSCT